MKLKNLGVMVIMTVILLVAVIATVTNNNKYNSVEAMKARAEYNNQHFHVVEDADGNKVMIPKE